MVDLIHINLELKIQLYAMNNILYLKRLGLKINTINFTR